MRRTWRWVLGVLIAIVLVTALSLWLLLRGSLADLDGEHALPGLARPVTIERDALGVVTITAGSQADAMRALGRVHAQERYFEMDLMRRSAAGELSALFGPKAIDADKRMRVHRLRARTEANLQAALGDNSEAVGAYVAGVNEGLAGLSVRPWAYLLLRQAPQPWRASDSVLTGLAMYADLQDPGNQTELALSRIRAVVPPALYALLAHDGSEWDAPLFGEPTGNAVLPDASQLDLRTLQGKPGTGQEEADAVGSNNFAVSGALTADGRAIVADDMHLGLRAPGLWFRVRLRYPDPQAAGGQVDVTGFSLPGLPAVIVGSNGTLPGASPTATSTRRTTALNRPTLRPPCMRNASQWPARPTCCSRCAKPPGDRSCTRMPMAAAMPCAGSRSCRVRFAWTSVTWPAPAIWKPACTSPITPASPRRTW